MKPIPYGKQSITQQDIDSVIQSLSSEYLTQGPKIQEFEKAFAKYIGCTYAVAVSNGTAALHLSAIALGVSEGDKVITSPITFSATANCIKYCGGEVVFCDIDPSSYLLDIAKVRKLLEENPVGTFKGIIPVDLGGLPTDLEKFRLLADEFGLWLLEDACHAPGGYFENSKGNKSYCGDGKYADLAIFSFHPVKHIATGEGGMITTNDVELYERLLMLRTHGITRDHRLFKNAPGIASSHPNISDYPGWYMEMQELGYNYRLTDFQSALGISQLKRADAGIEQRRRIAAKYDAAFQDKSFIEKQSGFNNVKIDGHAYHLYIIKTERRLQLYNFLRSKNIFAQVHYIPIHLMPYYKSLGFKEGDFPVAEEYYSKCLSLPMFPTLSEQEVDYVIACVLECLEA
ncbi:MAG: UDP-4-amino-4,6-dideoxy-N-acetyl-beta-L-altrosamine transaminase [Chryseolinea sp.]